MKALILLAALLAASTAHAAPSAEDKLHYLGASKGREHVSAVFLYTATVIRHKEYVRAWIAGLNSDLNGLVEDENGVAYTKELHLINCRKKTHTLKHAVFYDLTDQVVKNIKYDKLDFNPLIPGSVGEDIINNICAKAGFNSAKELKVPEGNRTDI